MVKCVGLRVSSGSFGTLGRQVEWKRHSVLREPIARWREGREGSDAVRQFRRMRMLSELMRAHRGAGEPKTLGEIIAQEAKAKLDKAEIVLAGVTLPA